jgi:hypothetical protein
MIHSVWVMVRLKRGCVAFCSSLSYETVETSRYATYDTVRSRTDNMRATVFLFPAKSLGKSGSADVIFALPRRTHLFPPRR